MGCIQTKKVDDGGADTTITKQIRNDRKNFEKEFKLLLLGAGDSGKSTIAKQMKILHLNGFTEQELLVYRPVIYNNTIQSIKCLIHAAIRFEYELKPENQSRLEYFAEVNPMKVELTPQIGEDVKALWADPAIQKTFERSNEFQLPGVAEYCFENIERVSGEDYIPSVEDALRCRARTTGIIETVFTVDRFTFRMVDVGGQRSERKKWIHCFQEVTALIFCVSLNEYDMKLFEDETVNRMHESIELFDEICNSEWFENTSIILFLNKSDLFQEKIKKVDLKICFPDYTGGHDYDNGWKFIRDKFLALNKNPGKKHVYTHVTCATDTENVKVVFNATKDIIMSNTLQSSGF